MKKFYSFFGVVSLCLLGFFPAAAQQNCPGPNPPAVFNESWVNPVTGEQICTLYIYNTWPNSRVRVSGVGGASIAATSGTIVFTDASGYACFVYPCNKTPLQVSVCNGTYCCEAPVPARSLLPVKLVGFNTRLGANASIELNWASTVEQESLKYVVERSSDGRHFDAIGEVDAAGNSSSTVRYSYTDKTNPSGIAFYRLKQVDADGKFIYSKVVYANSTGNSGQVTRIFPNPFRSDIQLIGISAADLNSGHVRVFSSEGRSVRFSISGTNAISIDETVPPGIYILQVNEQRFKLIKN